LDQNYRSFTRRRMLALAGQTAAAGAIASFAPLASATPRFRPETEDQDLTGAASLKAHAAASGLLFGCAVAPGLLDPGFPRYDPAYTALIREQASIIVAENVMKWGPMRPTPTTYNFDPADALVGFAERNRMKIRGHNLCWHRQLPTWFSSVATPANARDLLVAHIETVAGRYAGRMHSWDVVNEAIEPKDGRADGLRLSPWLKLAGDDYIELAFHTARRADPKALLTYNDYGIENETPEAEAKRAAVLMLLRRLRARRVPIDAVGVQSHIAAGPLSGAEPGAKSTDPRYTYGPGLLRFLAALRELDLQVFLTEMDVNDRALAPAIADRDRAVAATYQHYLNVVLTDPAVKAVLTWGITDRYTWLNGEDARADHLPERALPFDSGSNSGSGTGSDSRSDAGSDSSRRRAVSASPAAYRAKAAFFSLRSGLDKLPVRPANPQPTSL
jgi:endo-1,4-beta-xylanase